MEVRILKDYRGALSLELFLPAGSVVETPNGAALIEAGLAEAVEPPAAKPAPKKRGK